MRGAFVGARPPGWIAATSSPRGASATASHVGKRSIRRTKARPELASDVFWESIVSTSSATGSRCGRHSGTPYAASSRATISGIRATFGCRRGRRIFGRFGMAFRTNGFEAAAPLGLIDAPAEEAQRQSEAADGPGGKDEHHEPDLPRAAGLAGLHPVRQEHVAEARG